MSQENRTPRPDDMAVAPTRPLTTGFVRRCFPHLLFLALAALLLIPVALSLPGGAPARAQSPTATPCQVPVDISLGSDIDILDLTALLTGVTANPPMLNGQRALGSVCPHGR